MLDHKALWRILARNKAIQPHHVVQRVILQALDKANGNLDRAKRMVLADISTAFTPIKRAAKLENGLRPWGAVALAATEASHGQFNVKPRILGAPYEALGSLTEAYEVLCELLIQDIAINEYNNRQYIYIFVRQDLSREQQLVQAGHVALKAGYELAQKHATTDKGVLTGQKPDGLYFTVIGVANELELVHASRVLYNCGHRTTVFFEPDIGGQLTAIASEPIPVRERGKLMKFKLLKMR